MDTAKEGTAEPLQTVGDALAAQVPVDAFQRFAAKLVPDQADTAGEQTEPPKVEPEVTPENNGDLSHSATEPKPDDDDDAELSQATKERVQKRIDKEVAKRKAAEEQLAAERETDRAKLAELEAKLQELQSKQPAKPEPAPEPQNDPLLNHPEIKSIWAKEQEANQAYDVAKDYRKRLKRDPSGTLDELVKLYPKLKDVDDAEEFLESVRDNAFRQANDLASTRKLASDRVMRQAQEAQTKEFNEGLALYPWINDPKAKEQEVAKELLGQYPSLKAQPKLLGRMVAGVMLEQGRKTETTQPKAAPVIPPKIPTNNKVAAPVKADAASEVASLTKQAMKNGGRNMDLAAIIERKMT